MSNIHEAVFSASPVAMVVTDRDGRIVEANPAFRRLLEIDAAAGDGPRHLSLLASDQRAWDRTLEWIRVKGQWRGVFFLKKSQGRRLEALLWADRLESGPATEGHVLFSLIDLEEPIHQKTLSQSEERLRRLFASIPDAILLFDAESRAILDCNDAALQAYGYTVEELCAMTIEDLSGVSICPGSSLQRLTPASCEQSALCWRRRKDGSVFPVEIVEGAFTWRSRSVVCEVGRDISVRHKIETEKRHLDMAVEQAAEGIAITTPTGEITYVNPAFQSITGYHRSELIGANMGILNSGKQPPEFFDRFWETIERGRTWHGRMTDRRKDGDFVELESTVSPIVSADGQITNYVVVARDVSHEVRLERQLRQSQKMEAIGTLAGGIAHDFNNLLQSILGHSDIILEDAHPASRICKSAEQVMIAGNRARDLVSQILTFSRQTEHNRRPLFVSPIAKEALKLLRSSIPPHIRIEQRIEESEQPIMADAIQIHQVILNLCANAYQAMDASGGLLTLSLWERYLNEEDLALLPELKGPGHYVQLSVADTGPGMDEKTLERIFEPYFTTKTSGAGTGLGLATTLGIITNLGGAVRVTSRPGQGATFDVYLPLCEPFTESGDDEEPDFPLTQGNQRILFVDDEQAIIDFAQVALEAFGYRVDGFADSLEALAAFRKHPDRWDLILTDQIMPGLTGVELAFEAHRIRPNIPIMLISGYADFPSDQTLQDAGVIVVLRKPLRAARIALEIQQIMK